MALAWKAGWVQALTSSNLVSSATEKCALTRAYTSSSAPLEASAPRFVRYLCAIFRGGPLCGGLWRTSRAGPGRRVRSARLAAPEGSQGRSGVQVQLEFRAELPSGGPSDLEVTGPYPAQTERRGEGPSAGARPAILVSEVLQSSSWTVGDPGRAGAREYGSVVAKVRMSCRESTNEQLGYGPWTTSFRAGRLLWAANCFQRSRRW